MEADNRIKKRNRLERKVKFIALCSITYACLYVFVETLWATFNDFSLFVLPIHVPLYFFMSVTLIKTYLQKHKEIFTFLFYEEADNTDWVIRMVKVLGIGILYFTFQVSFFIVIHPSFFEIEWMKVPLYLPIFSANAFIAIKWYQTIYPSEYVIKKKKSEKALYHNR